MKTTITAKELKIGDMFIYYNEYYYDFYIKIVSRLVINNSGNIRVLFEYVDHSGRVRDGHYTLSMEYRVTKISI